MNAPSFLVIGDLHIHVTNLDEAALLREFLVKTARERRKEYHCIVILGDILDTNNIIRSEAHVVASELLGELSEIAPLLVLMGNHDLLGPLAFLSKVHGFTQLKRWVGTCDDGVSFPSGTGVQVVDTEPVVFTVCDVPFCALPYIPPGRFQEALALNPHSTSARAIFCHQEFRGCDIGGGRLSAVDETSPSLWISGHIHEHQRVEGGLYVGTPRQVKIDENFFKTISLIQVEEKELKEERISTNLPPRCHIKTTTAELGNFAVPDYGRVKIELSGTVHENKAAKRHALVKEWKKKGFIVKFHDLITTKSIKKADTIVQRNRLNFTKLCEISAAEAGLSHIYDEIFS